LKPQISWAHFFDAQCLSFVSEGNKAAGADCGQSNSFSSDFVSIIPWKSNDSIPLKPYRGVEYETEPDHLSNIFPGVCPSLYYPD